MNECYNDAVMQEEIETLIDENDFSFLKNSTVLITGATGLIGSYIARVLACLNRKKQFDICILLQIRNKDKAEKLFGKEFLMRNDIELIVQDITEELSLKKTPDYVFHTASPTSSRFFVSNPVETIKDAVLGTDNVLRNSRNSKGVVYFSSLEVYGIPEKEFVDETCYGYIDFLNIRSSYSEGKRLCENLCVSYYKEYDVPVKIVRLSQTFGTGVNYSDSRVFAEFIRCVIERKDITLHTAGNTVRSYIDIKDAVSGAFTVMEKGKPGEAYNLSNPDTAVSIREMAELVANTFPEAGIKVVTDIPENVSSYGYNPEMKIILDVSKAKALGWQPETGLKEMFIKTKDSIGIRALPKDERHEN